MEMEKRLYEAALEGSVSTLKALVQQDPLILDRICTTFFHETPLHIAALRGHVDFAREIMIHNSSLSNELDSLGHSPLHLASAKGHVEIVRAILRVSRGTCLARSKDGKMPLHLAIVKGGRVEVVKELARACPETTRSRVDRGDTVLHLCVKYDNLDALQVLVEELMVGNDGSDLMNARNEDGNTILHLAALHKNLEIMKYILGRPGIELNAANNNSLTALDIIENSPRDVRSLEVQNFLLQSNAQRATDNSISLQPKKTQASVDTLKNNARPHPRPRSKSWKTFFTFGDNNHLEKLRGELFITAALIAVINVLPVINMKVNGPDSTDGYATISLSFVPSVTIMLMLLSGFSLKNKFCGWLVVQLLYTALGFLGSNFFGTMISFESRYLDNTTFVVMFIWFGLMLIVSALNVIRLVVWIVTCIKASVKRRKLRAEKKNPLLNA